MRFRRENLLVCDRLACGHLRLEGQRRTILLAPGAFDSAARLRASLLEIWGRYRSPRLPSLRERAEGALRIVRDGPCAGIQDQRLLRDAHHWYHQLYGELGPEEARGLPPPDRVPFP
ncbi:MAG: hypothetical protein ACE5FG_03740 [Myxococcota bacterium]